MRHRPQQGAGHESGGDSRPQLGLAEAEIGPDLDCQAPHQEDGQGGEDQAGRHRRQGGAGSSGVRAWVQSHSSVVRSRVRYVQRRQPKAWNQASGAGPEGLERM